MFDLIKEVINSRDYKLEDMLYKINKMYVESYLTEEEKTELDNLARENADTVNSYAPIQEQIDNLYVKISNLEDRVKLLEKTEEPGEEEEYKEFVQPTGAHNAYNVSDKIIYNGKKYICKMDGCVWSPDTYPAAWEEVTNE
jgi:hypothetical protein|nr:MAG TPA: ChiA1-BD-binding domain protein [Caudoviricetes sp.]